MIDTVVLVGLLARPDFASLIGVSGQVETLPGRLVGGARAGWSRDGWPGFLRGTGVTRGLRVRVTPRLRRYGDIMGLAPVNVDGHAVLGIGGVARGGAAPAAEQPLVALALAVARRVLSEPPARAADAVAARLPMIAGVEASRLRAEAEGVRQPGGPDINAMTAVQAADRDDGPETATQRVAGFDIPSARADDPPATGTRLPRDGDGLVETVSVDQPYAAFFSVEERRLRHRRYDGGWSPVLNRAVFMSGDAVVVLPWDPVRDVVMLIEQFRAGPSARHDPQPWIIEAIAGRIDAGETPEAAARREAAEEAGLTLGALIAGPHNYPSTGAFAEFLYLYVGICDLRDDAAGLGGLESEHEDIRSLIVPRAELTRRARAGEIVNGPLLSLALWLELEAGRIAAGTR